MNADQNLKTEAPQTACIFNDHKNIAFVDAEKSNEFAIVGYSGGIIKDHWWWGNVAFDLTGMKFAKKTTPVLEEHFTTKRLGFSTDQKITNQVEVKGKFLGNEGAQQLKADMKAGFPMEASLYVPPTSIEFVKDGESVQVNGQNLKGPGAVFRKSTVKEVSMCVFGADANARSKAFNANEKNIKFNLIEGKKAMAEKQENQMSVDILKTDHADVYDQVFVDGKAAGEKAERDLFSELQKVCGDDDQLLVESYIEGRTTEAALMAKNEKLAAENKKLQDQAAAARPAAPAKTEPADIEFSDDGPGKKPDPAKSDVENWTDEFTGSKQLQKEFPGPEGIKEFIAWKKAETAGLAKVKSIK